MIRKGEVSRKAHAFTEAIPLYLQALELAPENGILLLHLADAYRGMKDLGRSLLYYRKYLEDHPLDALVHSRAGDAYKKTGCRDLAITHYQAALQIDSGNRPALMGLGDLHHKEHNIGETLKYWERLLALDPTLLNIQTMVGNIHRQKFNFAKAVVCFERVLQAAPENPYAIFGMADALRGEGRFEEAVPHWEAMLALDRHNKQVLTRAGDCFLRLGHLPRAADLFEEALLQGFDKSALLGLARVFTARKDFNRAQQCYKRILDRQPKDARTLSLVAQSLVHSKGAEAARAFLQRQLARYPELKELQGALANLEAGNEEFSAP